MVVGSNQSVFPRDPIPGSETQEGDAL